MKKFAKLLAMVLAVSMVLTMFVGAVDYTDTKDVTKEQAAAIEAVYNWGIMEGYNNAFRPNDPVTRDEMAKIMYALKEVGLTPNALYSSFAGTFADAADLPTWSKSFVGYAAVEGIFVGNDKNEFNALDDVTYIQAAIVLLRALGEETAATDKVPAEYTGTNWYTNALKDAMANNLFADIDVADLNSAATRADIAVMIKNAVAKATTADGFDLAKEISGTVTGVYKNDKDVEFFLIDGEQSEMKTEGYDVDSILGKEIVTLGEEDGDDFVIFKLSMAESKEVKATLDQLSFNQLKEKDKDGKEIGPKYRKDKDGNPTDLIVTELKKDKEVLLKDIFDYDLYIFNGSKTATKYVNGDPSSSTQLGALIAAEMQKQEVTIVINETSVSVFYAPIVFVNFDADKIVEDYDSKKGWLGTYKYDGQWTIDNAYESLKDGVYAAQIIDKELIIVGTTTEVDGTKVVATKNADKEVTVKVNGEEAVVVYDAVYKDANKVKVFETINKAGIEAFSENDIYNKQGNDLGSVIMYGDWIISAKRADNTPDKIYGVVTEITYGKGVDADDLDNDKNKTEVIEIATVIVNTTSAEFEVKFATNTPEFTALALTENTLYEITLDGDEFKDATKVDEWTSDVVAIKDSKVGVANIASDAKIIFVNLVDDAELADVTVELKDGEGYVTVAGKKVLKDTVKAFWIEDSDIDVVVVVYDLEAEFGVYGEINQ